MIASHIPKYPTTAKNNIINLIANANVILNQLYKHTQMQDTFGVIMLALVNGEPKVLNLLEVLTCYLDHQKDVVTRRTRYEHVMNLIKLKKELT